MQRKLHILICFVAITSLLYGCFKNESYPLEPVISEPEVVLLGDSAQLSFSFTDGDGDIGLNDDEISPPYDTSSKYHFNLYVEYYEKDDINGWQPGVSIGGDTVVFMYRLERIEIKGKARGIKGTMDVIMSDFYDPFSDQSDTVKYRIQLIDRALNESNWIETDPLVHGL